MANTNPIYTDAVATATDLLAEYGAAITITHGSTIKKTVGVFKTLKRFDDVNQMIESAGVEVTVSAAPLGKFRPDVGDYLTRVSDKAVFVIADVEEVKPADTLILYKIMVRS